MSGGKVNNEELLAALKRYDSCTLSNAIETFDVRPKDVGFTQPQMHCIFPEMEPMVGYAATAKIRAKSRGPEDQTIEMWELVASMQGPRVLVVRDLDEIRVGSLWGEVHANMMQACGCVGTVTDGCVRDLEQVKALGFHFFATDVCVSHAYIRVVEAGGEVEVAGLKVNSGDLLHGDRHGVLLIPWEVAPNLPAAADALIEREQETVRWTRSVDFTPEKLIERRRQQARARAEAQG